MSIIPKQRVEKWFGWGFLIILLTLLIGNPLLFTSMTRSVFEVNKLLCLRLTSILAAGLWLFKYLVFRDNNLDNAKEESYSVFGLRWKKIGLEIPMLIWLGFNVISTVFSTNIIISIIGAYDRWEGIITVLNYTFLWYMFAKLVTEKFQLHWILGVVVITTACSSMYGVCQSLGLDFMNWSVNASARVFACINNPVHFCAYVGMVIPLSIGWLLYLGQRFPAGSSRSSTSINVFKGFVFFSTALIFYAQLLSFSRATWLGFCAAMTYFFLLLTVSLRGETKKTFLLDFLLSVMAIGVFYLLFIFKVYSHGLKLGLPLGLLLAGYVIYSYRSFIPQWDLKHGLVALMSFSVLFFCYVIDLRELLGWTGVGISFLLVAYFVRICLKADESLRLFLSRFVIILLFIKLQFVAISVVSLALYLCLAFCFYLLEFRKNNPEPEKDRWLFAFLVMFGIVISIPTLQGTVSDLLKGEKELLALKNAQGKLQTYERDALKGTARTSMWKSSFPWIKDYWLIGSGLDTIKFNYPDYRRPEYGILEGGHNFTPDRLHNEYLNTLATRGIPATFVYYVCLIGGWFVLLLSKLYDRPHNKFRFLVYSCLASAGVYLGQVFFNFGVVATLVIFYAFIGLGQALVSHPAFIEDDTHE
jgi:hypothetical protein